MQVKECYKVDILIGGSNRLWENLQLLKLQMSVIALEK